MLRKDMLLHFVLFCIIGFCLFLFLTTKYEPPEVTAKNITKDIPKVVPKDLSESVYNISVSNAYPNLGKKEVFKTIIPRPTPNPTPTPSPIPTPDLGRSVSRWKVTALLDDMASFEDTATRTPFDIKLGEKKEVQFRNQTFEVLLESIDMNELSVTLRYQDQTRKITMTF